MLADEARGGLELFEARNLHELLGAVNGAAHRTTVLVLAIRERECLETEVGTERADEEEAEGLRVLHAPVVAGDVRTLQTAVLGDERDAVDEGEVLAHGVQRSAGRTYALDGVVCQCAEGMQLVEEGVVIDARFFTDAGREPPRGFRICVEIGAFSSNLLDGGLGVGRMERGRELLLVTRDHVQRTGEARIEAEPDLEHARHARDERELAVDVPGPATVIGDARDGLADVIAHEVEIGDRETIHAVDHENEKISCDQLIHGTSTLEFRPLAICELSQKSEKSPLRSFCLVQGYTVDISVHLVVECDGRLALS